eukprot:TRINITY_DN75951_c0_g1_i1.p1 TRINITY_DN75951_c0_g1~~TRINITY_DN75951_c0_g1_i1.p1  ORF type:complete len:492 (+),score=50.33 TRINITY_DN75951_c0_g1_i1:82-1557(+)
MNIPVFLGTVLFVLASQAADTVDGAGIVLAMDQAMQQEMGNAVLAMCSSLQGHTFPDHSGHHYTLSDVRVTEARCGSFTILPAPPSASIITVQNINFGLSAHAKAHDGWAHASGTLTASASEAHISVKLQWGERDGKPTLSATATTDLNADLHWHGSAGWIINPLLHLFKKDINNMADKEIDKLVKAKVEQVTIAFQEKPNPLILNSNLALNWALDCTPHWTSSMFAICLKADFVPPSPPGLIPPFADTDKLPTTLGTADAFQMIVGVHTFNSLVWSMAQDPSLEYLIKANTFSSGLGIVPALNTTEWKARMPALYKMYPNRAFNIKVRLAVDNGTIETLSGGVLGMQLPLQLDFLVQPGNVRAFSLALVLSIDAKLKVQTDPADQSRWLFTAALQKFKPFTAYQADAEHTTIHVTEINGLTRMLGDLGIVVKPFVGHVLSQGKSFPKALRFGSIANLTTTSLTIRQSQDGWVGLGGEAAVTFNPSFRSSL